MYDTLRGARGELHVKVKLEFIGNENPFRDSSAGVRFFALSSLSPEVTPGGGWGMRFTRGFPPFSYKSYTD